MYFFSLSLFPMRTLTSCAQIKRNVAPPQYVRNTADRKKRQLFRSHPSCRVKTADAFPRLNKRTGNELSYSVQHSAQCVCISLTSRARSAGASFRLYPSARLDSRILHTFIKHHRSLPRVLCTYNALRGSIIQNTVPDDSGKCVKKTGNKMLVTELGREKTCAHARLTNNGALMKWNKKSERNRRAHNKEATRLSL